MWLGTPRGFYAAVARPDDGHGYVRPAGIGSSRRPTPSSAATRRTYGTPAGSGPWVVTDRRPLTSAIARRGPLPKER
jgi:hypothetical protein